MGEIRRTTNEQTDKALRNNYIDIENKKSKSRFIKVYNLNNGIQIGEILLKESENYD